MHTVHDVGVAAHIGKYSDAIEVAPGARWLYSAGTPGVRPDGSLPESITEQSEQAWRNIVAMLDGARMTIDDIVKVTHTLIDADDIPDYVAVRSKFLGDARPASMLLVIPQLVRPGILVEIEIVAARLD